MAIDNQFGKGIGVAAGFDLGAQKPLDARIAVNTIAERDAHVENNRAYEGMIVFVDETKKNYQLINGAWQELAKAEQDRLDALEAMLNGGEGAEGGALGALQDDIDALEEKTGVKAEYEENGDVKVAATGMYKYIDDQDAKLQDNIGAAVEGMEAKVEGEKERAVAEEGKIRQELANALADAKAHAEAEDVKVKNAQATKDSEQDNKILALEQLFKGENSVDNKIAAVQDDLDTFKQSQDTAHKALVQKDGELNQAIIDEAAKAREEEGKLQSTIDAIEKRLDDPNGLVDRIEANEAFIAAQPAIDQEQDRRLKALEDTNAEGGAIKKAIDAAQKAADDAQDAADAAQADVDVIEGRLDNEGGLVDRLEAVEGFVKDHDHKPMEDRLDALEAKFGEGENTVEDMIADAQAAAEAEAARLDGVLKGELQAKIDKKVAIADYNVKMKALDDEDARIAGLVATEQGRAEGVEQAINAEIANMKDATKEGSLAKQIADEVSARQQADTGLDNRLKAVEASIGDGGDLEKRVEANEDAIKVINGEGEGSIKKAVADLVNGAPEALNTLDELAAALRDNADVLDAVEEAFDNKLSSQKTALQKEIDDDVKVVADELAKQKDAAQEGTLAKQIADEASRAAGQEAAIRGEFAAADNALKAALQKEIDDDVKAEADIARAAEKANADAIAAINNAENGILAQAKAYAKGLDDAMDGRMDTAEGEIDDLQEFVQNHDHSDMEQDIADNAAAIEVLNGDENKDGSVAKAVKAEADRAKLAEEALDSRITSIFAAYDGDNEYPDLAPLI